MPCHGLGMPVTPGCDVMHAMLCHAELSLICHALCCAVLLLLCYAVLCCACCAVLCTLCCTCSATHAIHAIPCHRNLCLLCHAMCYAKLWSAMLCQCIAQHSWHSVLCHHQHQLCLTPLTRSCIQDAKAGTIPAEPLMQALLEQYLKRLSVNRATLKALFAAGDTDSDGLLDRPQARAALLCAQPSLSDTVLTTIWLEQEKVWAAFWGAVSQQFGKLNGCLGVVLVLVLLASNGRRSMDNSVAIWCKAEVATTDLVVTGLWHVECYAAVGCWSGLPIPFVKALQKAVCPVLSCTVITTVQSELPAWLQPRSFDLALNHS